MASQQDVAKRANVSYMTVSRVVNKCGNVKKETEERVLKAIAELSYHPNAAARTLNSKRTNNIGIVLPKKEYLLTAPFYIELLLSVERHLRAEGFSLFLGTLHDDDENRDYSVLYKEGKVDGLIVFAPPYGDSFLSNLLNDNVPFIVVLGRSEEHRFSFVDADNFKSSGEAVNYLIGLNHRRIGFVSGNTREVNAYDRLEGYKMELLQNSIAFDEQLVYYGDWSLESGYEAFKYLFSLDNPPTAVFCANDYMAMGVIKAANDSNVRVPEDLSIVGFDDLQYSSFITPSLTTMRQPVEKIAVKAAEVIVDRVRNRDAAVEEAVFKSDFIIRKSCRGLT